MPQLKVAIVGLTRFHLFELASELASNGCLETLYTGYPRAKLPDQLQQIAKTSPLCLMPLLAIRAGCTWGRMKNNLERVAALQFDSFVSRNLTRHDILVGLAGQSLESFKAAKRIGAKTVCERGSAHILFQDRLLREEHDRWGLTYKPIDSRLIDQELAEYDVCDSIAVPSLFAEQSFVSLGTPKSKLIRNPYGVSLSDFRPLPIAKDAFRVVFAGAISIQKGVLDLLAAAKLLGSRVEVVMAGKMEPGMPRLLGSIGYAYTHVGFLNRSQLCALYSSGSVFVLPSIQDGLGLVQVQAMACGLPVIATTNTGAYDLFEDGKAGFIVPIRSPQLIAASIEELIRDPERREAMSRECLKTVSNMGGWRDYGVRALSQYRQLVQLQ